jgi:hypothetical protein
MDWVKKNFVFFAYQFLFLNENNLTLLKKINWKK